MLNNRERARFNELRDRRDEGDLLSEEETIEVAAFVQRLEDAEASYLTKATERLHRENQAAVARLQALNELASREEQFLNRVQQTLHELRREREFLNAQRQQLVTAS